MNKSVMDVNVDIMIKASLAYIFFTIVLFVCSSFYNYIIMDYDTPSVLAYNHVFAIIGYLILYYLLVIIIELPFLIMLNYLIKKQIIYNKLGFIALTILFSFLIVIVLYGGGHFSKIKFSAYANIEFVQYLLCVLFVSSTITWYSKKWLVPLYSGKSDN